MKNLFIMCLSIAFIGLSSCGNSTQNGDKTSDSIATDTLSAYVSRIDSIKSGKTLGHMTVYNLGKIKSIEFQVVSLAIEQDTVEYVNLKKDCGGEYYYDWVDSYILMEEIKNFMAAIDTVSANFDRQTETEERYFYVTRDNIRLFSSNNGGGTKWSAQLSVDYRKSDSHINMSKEDLITLKELLQQGEQKIKSIHKK